MVSDITVLSTGGTIASTKDSSGDGASPSKEGAELVEAVPAVSAHGEVSTREVTQVPSFDMSLDGVAAIGDAAAAAAEAGADGIVVTHGTDTMEESAYGLDLTRDLTPPVVFTGAQRRPDEHSADGAANLLTAVRAASHEQFRGAGGVYVAFDAELHAARDVTKGHTSALGTFRSPDAGPVASVPREGLRLHRSPGSRSDTLPVDRTDADVAIVTSAAGVGRRAMDAALEAGVDGIVVEGTGLGNTTAAIGDAIADAVRAGVPVVVASRCQGGSTAPVYGTGGGGQTLVDHGAVQAGALPAQKARLKLAFLCAAGHTSPAAVAERF
jgi:L-asparaginase